MSKQQAEVGDIWAFDHGDRYTFHLLTQESAIPGWFQSVGLTDNRNDGIVKISGSVWIWVA